ncbi:unnamed protein product [Meganyctiphanes norvegica]|uniref:Polysaccharide biosynthesis domain-containing protein n=1 Tax=Meganyctiphanes norvegica TaxID=48144 RepID=A0AAV2RRI8_MEGNR
MAKPTQEEILKELGISGAGATIVTPGGSAPSGNSDHGDSLGNDPTMEGMWALKAMEHAEIHFNLLCALDPSLLKLTPKDDVIYEEFRKEFPDFKIDKLAEDTLKSPAAKEKWRPFCNKFQEEVEDFSFATLVRIDCNDEYSEKNTILVTRIQFLCIEVARNREKFNESIRHNFKPKPRTKKINA